MTPRPMRAARYQGNHVLGVEGIEIPAPGPGEARVRVRACGICGTDLHFFQQGMVARGLTPGHEIAGEVDAVGPGVSGLEPGARVAVEPLRSCGACASCRAGRDSICPALRVLGIHLDGGFADFVVAPARRLFRVPADLPAQLAALAEPAAVVIHGLRRGALEAGQRVLVQGAGAVGLLGVLAARALGAGEVLATARHAHQAALAREFGAARVLSEAESDAAGLAALARTRPADVVLETVGGHADTLRAAAAALAPGGRIAVVGVFLGPLTLDPMPLLLKEGTLAWSNCYARGQGRADFEAAIELLSAQRELVAKLVTDEVPLDEIGRAYTRAADRRAGSVKVSVRP